jgi:hypothetical protein
MGQAGQEGVGGEEHPGAGKEEVVGSVFISGIPASGKTYLADKVAQQTGAIHVDLDATRAEMLNIESLEPWVSFFWNQDEDEYWDRTTKEEHWDNLVLQSEMLWPFLLQRIKGTRTERTSVIFECVNILPHLAKRDLDFTGIYLLGESTEAIIERLRQVPRWGGTEELQRKEALCFFQYEGSKYKQEAEKHTYKAFYDNAEAEKELIRLLL